MFSRKIFIPFENYKTVGGPTTFMSNLKGYLDRTGYAYKRSSFLSKGIFFPIAYDLETLRKIKRKGGKIIQRLDGIFYPSKHGEEYIELNRNIKEIYSDLADFIVFQSEYSRKQCFSMFGEKKPEESTIITNGVNKKIFFPAEKEISVPEKFILTTTGNFRNPDMLEPIVKALDELIGKINFEFWVIGPVTNPELEKFLDRKYIKHLGSKNMQEIAQLLRQSDIFLYSHLNPPCPNSVLEAVATGLPVVGFDSGAMSELLFFQKDLLAYVSEDIFQKYEDFDYRKLQAKIELAVQSFPQCKKIAMENCHLYSFEECGKKYVKIFNDQ